MENKGMAWFFPLAGVINQTELSDRLHQHNQVFTTLGTKYMYYLTKFSEVKVCRFYHLKSRKILIWFLTYYAKEITPSVQETVV